jgi:uracil-DNA glycosylase family 4
LPANSQVYSYEISSTFFFMVSVVPILIDALENLRRQGQSTIPLSAENFAFLEKGPRENSRPLSQKIPRKTKKVLPEMDSSENFAPSNETLLSMERKNFSNKQEHWEDLKARVLHNGDLKKHVRPGKQLVFGVGNLDAKIFFCGEAPGADEEIQGIPFVGRAGQLLTKIIAAMGFSRDQVYIGNIMNWRPEMDTESGNRPPTQDEMQFCLPYLIEQVEIVRPAVIVALGATAVSGLLGPDKNRKISLIRGKWHEFCGTPLMITFHPSYLLRNSTNQTKRLVWEDMLQVMTKIGMPISERQRSYFLES